MVLYHPDNALVGMELAEHLGLADWAYASRYLPRDEVWVTQEPQVIARYEALLETQRDFSAKAAIK
jgi:hypothetical protein